MGMYGVKMVVFSKSGVLRLSNQLTKNVLLGFYRILGPFLGVAMHFVRKKSGGK
jgi:hypothetical protein